MSQYDFGTIDPYVVDGVQLASMLNNWRDAVHSWHRGASRPGYIVPGMMWINDTGGATNWVVNVYLSPTVGDVAMFTYNTSTGAITLSAAAGGTFAAAILLAQAAATPSVRWNATGNPVDAKAWRATVDAAGALVLSSYNDAGAVQQSFTFNRDGTTTNSVPTYGLRLYAETVLASANAEMRVNIPAGAKAVELWFVTANSASAADNVVMNALNGASILTPASHNTQWLYGSGSTAAALFTSAAVAWNIANNVVNSYGVFRPMYVTAFSQVLATSQSWAINSSTRYAVSNSHDGGSATVPTGYRLANTGAATFATGSYLRAFVAY
jgi:hypothetical protein